MPFVDKTLTRKQALAPYNGTERERILALAQDLGIDHQVIEHWNDKVPRWWSIIIVNLVHPDKFKAERVK